MESDRRVGLVEQRIRSTLRRYRQALSVDVRLLIGILKGDPKQIRPTATARR